MNQQRIETDAAPRPIGPYSQGIKAGGFIYTAGQIALDPHTGKLVEGAIEEQTRQVIQNIQAILEAGGATLADVIKTTVHLSDMADFPKFNAVYLEFFSDPFPVRTTVGSVLPKGALLEIDVVACAG